jgi:hypothetical protein
MSSATRITSILLTGVLTLLAACAPPSAPVASRADEPFRIGISAALTGPNAAVYAAVYESINI